MGTRDDLGLCSYSVLILFTYIVEKKIGAWKYGLIFFLHFCSAVEIEKCPLGIWEGVLCL